MNPFSNENIDKIAGQIFLESKEGMQLELDKVLGARDNEGGIISTLFQSASQMKMSRIDLCSVKCCPDLTLPEFEGPFFDVKTSKTLDTGFYYVCMSVDIWKDKFLGCGFLWMERLGTLLAKQYKSHLNFYGKQFRFRVDESSIFFYLYLYEDYP